MIRPSFSSVWLLSLGCETMDEPADSDRPPVDPLPAATVSLLPAGQANLLVPIQVGLDPIGRRLYVSSNGLPTLAEVDLDAAALVAVHDLSEMSALHPLVAADEEGLVWLGFQKGAPLASFDPTKGVYTVVDVRVAQVHALVSVEGGGAVAAGAATEGGHDVLLALRQDTSPLQFDLVGSVLGLDPATGGGVNALVSDARAEPPAAMVTLSGDTLVEQARCALADGQDASSGFSWFDELPGVGFAISQGRTVAALDCGTGLWNELPVPGENYAVFGLSDGTFAVLDRVGGADRNWGLARTFDSALSETRDAVQVGKNSGYGARDPATGLVWMNSEGTGEVWAWRPESGEVEARVRLGAHVESITIDPSAPDVVVFTGRLSSSVGRANLRTGELVVVEDTLTWPVSPCFIGSRLFMLDDLTSTVVELDPISLSVMQRFDVGLGPNSTLTLSDLAADAERGWLYVSNGGTGDVAALDVDSGAIAGAWSLLGATPDADTPGRLELAVAAGGLVALRNSDGELRRLDPDSGAVLSATADGRSTHFVVRGHALDSLAVSDDGLRVWSGPWAFDALTLAEAESLTDDVLVVRDAGAGGLMAWSSVASQVIRMDAARSVTFSAPTSPAPWGFPGFAVRGDDGDQGIVLGSYDRAELQYVPVEEP